MTRRVSLLACVAALGLTAAATARPAPGHKQPTTGGAPLGGLAPTGRRHHRRARRYAGRRWLRGFTITQYWPAPESWFVGKLVRAPGLSGLHRIDWLYSATGVSMQGEGIGLDGRLYHLASAGNGGWVTAQGRPTSPGNVFAAGVPYWRSGGYWRGPHGAVTFPLAAGGWSSGRGRRYVPLRGVSFAPGPSLPLRYYQSIAVDPSVIPLGSKVYVPAYRNDGHGGWFIAQDTGGAINGRRIDVYRPPPALPTAAGQSFTAQRVLVIEPRAAH